MRYKKLMMLTIILAFLLAISAVSAVDNSTEDILNVDAASDYVVSVEEDQSIEQINNNKLISTTDSGTFTALQNKINKAKENSTITLENDYSYDNGFDTNGITVEKTLTIDGKGHTIDGKKSTKIFLFKASNIVVKNLRFINGNGENGGAISCYGPIKNCSVIDCIFKDCHSNRNGGALNSVTAINCTFIGNGAANYGGVIYEGSAINCRFINNSVGGYGGAVYISSDNKMVVNCSFIGNSASRSGGAIYISQFAEANIIVSDCSFKNNIANYNGGALYWDGSGGKIMNCEFTKNGANDTCGAVYAKSVNLDSCNFTLNHAKSIGAVSSWGLITNCIFTGNCALENCGALYWDLNPINCTFINNSATDCGAIEIPKTMVGSYSPDSYYYNDMTNLVFVNNTPNDFGGGYSVIGNTIFVYPESTYGCALTGNITVHIAGKTFNMSLDDFLQGELDYVTTPKIDITGVATGDYETTVIYSGGVDVRVITEHMEYGPSEMRFMMHIESKMQVSSSDVEKYCGGDEKFTVTVTDDNVAVANAEVRMTVNGKVQTAKTDSKGKASFSVDLPVGTYDVVSTYNGVSATSKVTVKSTLTASDTSGTYSNSKCTATFLDTAGKVLTSKKVTFKVVDKSYSATTNSSGVASANIPLGVGTYTVVAVNPVNNEQKMFKLTISKADSKIVLTSIQSNGVTTLTATLTPTTASGNVVFNVNGENRNVQINNGKATLALKDLEAGNYTVAVIYNGDTNLKASTSNTVTFSVAEAYPVLTAKAVTKTYGTSTKLVVNLADNKGNAIANADVSVVMGSATTHIKTDSSGKATMSINKAPGTYTATITYLDAKTTAKITVKKATPKLTAKAKTFKKSVKTKKYTVTLKTNQNKVMKNTKLTLKVNGKTYKATTNTKGQATFKITKLTKKGKFTAVVKFAGNKYYNAKTVKPKITVK